MKCPKCGKEIANDSQFCEYCGNKINPVKKTQKIYRAVIAVILCIGVIAGVIYQNKVHQEALIEANLRAEEARIVADKKAKKLALIMQGYVDLGLPSGTLWKEYNENCGLITYDQARHYYGNSLPTKEQWEELISNCVWTWIGNGYRIKGSNGKSITLPAAGFSDENGFSDSEMVGQVGYYWSLTLSDDNIGYSWGLPFDSDFIGLPGLGEIPHKYGQSIRLIKLSKEK